MNALIIFIKNPSLGKVKTRLAKDVGNAKALQIYKSLLSYTRSVSLLVDAKRYLFYSDQIVSDEWSPDQFTKKSQSGKNLGEKMSNAFRSVLTDHPKVLIVGSDCPQLDLMTMSKAYAALDTHDFVIGPSKDGGYYLLGMKSSEVDIFSDIAWSTSKVLEQTTKKISAANKTYHLLREMSDVDFLSDWETYGWEL